MSNAARSSFKVARLALALTLASALTGCATSGKLGFIDSLLPQKAVMTGSVSKAEAVSAPKSTKEKKDTIVTATVPARPKSQWCNYIAADAGAEASILRSPTLNASASDGGASTISLGMNLLDFMKADMIEETAQLRCEQKATEGSLQAMLVVANQSSTALGAGAKAAHLKNNLGRLDSVAAQTNELLEAGYITGAEASMVETRIAQVRQSYSSAATDAAKLAGIAGGKTLTVTRAASRLRAAEQKLQETNARMRTLNALNVNVETGWQRRDSDVVTTSSDSGAFFGKVSLGLRIGAISPQRMAYEEEAKAARVAALNETYTGIVWQSDQAGQSVETARKNLGAARKAIAGALTKARQTLDSLRGSDRIELASTQLVAEIDTISLGAELVGIDASLKALKENGALVGSSNQ
jgi:hypothetical protein